jgi:hypothetical protein
MRPNIKAHGSTEAPPLRRTWNQITAPEDIARTSLGLEAWWLPEIPFPLCPLCKSVVLTDRDRPSVTINRGAERLSSFIRGYHAHTGLVQQANQTLFLRGVKEEMVMINPSRRNCFISEQAIIRSLVLTVAMGVRPLILQHCALFHPIS